MNETWAKRCCWCGEYARGHGEVPDLPDHWVCGLCTAEGLWEEGTEHVLADQHATGTSACHYVVIDLDVDREP